MADKFGAIYKRKAKLFQMAYQLTPIIMLLWLSVGLVLSSHQQMAQMDRMEGHQIHVMEMDQMRGMEMDQMRGMERGQKPGMVMTQKSEMDMAQMRGMDADDGQMRASWAASQKLLRAEQKEKGPKSQKNETEKPPQQKQPQEKPGAQQNDPETEEDSKEDKRKPIKCQEERKCYAHSECGARSKCEPATLERKKKVGTCDCGVCGGFQLLLLCGLNSGALSLDKNIVPRECAGLKDACVEKPLFVGSKSKKCDCEVGFQKAGFKNLRDGQKKVCNKQKCDGKKDTCFGMNCYAGKCRCHLADL
ncbi:hypothetical protein niasHT_016320 [Heterodera trifolii]|uniref:Uncharacterized protein n=1 Tax=Heterodera trifolii TaxID=157864 RepID=A0ABD2L0U2_9BILA